MELNEEKVLLRLKKELRERAEAGGFGKEFAAQLMERLKKDDPRHENYLKNNDSEGAETYLIRNTISFLKMLENVPEKEREEFLDRRFAELKYSRELYRIRAEAGKIMPFPFEEKFRIGLEERLEKLLLDSDKGCPNLRKACSWEIYALRQYMMGMSLVGRMGSLEFLDMLPDDIFDARILEIEPDDRFCGDIVFFRNVDKCRIRESFLDRMVEVNCVMQSESKHKMFRGGFSPETCHMVEGHCAIAAFEDLKENKFIPEELREELGISGVYFPWAMQRDFFYKITGRTDKMYMLKFNEKLEEADFDRLFGEGAYKRIFHGELGDFDAVAELLRLSVIKEVCEEGKLQEEAEDYSSSCKNNGENIQEMKPDSKCLSKLERILEKANPQWKGMPKEQSRYYLTFWVERVLGKLDGELDESNIEGAECLLKEEGYDSAFRGLIRKAAGLKSGDLKGAGKLKKELYSFLEGAEEEFPDYKSERRLEISDLRGDILAAASKGLYGSTRKSVAILWGR